MVFNRRAHCISAQHVIASVLLQTVKFVWLRFSMLPHRNRQAQKIKLILHFVERMMCAQFFVNFSSKCSFMIFLILPHAPTSRCVLSRGKPMLLSFSSWDLPFLDVWHHVVRPPLSLKTFHRQIKWVEICAYQRAWNIAWRLSCCHICDSKRFPNAALRIYDG